MFFFRIQQLRQYNFNELDYVAFRYLALLNIGVHGDGSEFWKFREEERNMH